MDGDVIPAASVESLKIQLCVSWDFRTDSEVNSATSN